MNGKVDKRNLTVKDIEFIRKTCRALNMIANVRKDKLNSTLLKESMNEEFLNLCDKDITREGLLEKVLKFDEEKKKYKLNWK